MNVDSPLVPESDQPVDDLGEVSGVRRLVRVQELDGEGPTETGNPGFDAVVVPGRVIRLVVLQSRNFNVLKNNYHKV